MNVLRSIRTLLKEGVRQDNITVLTLDDTQGFDEPSFKSYLMEVGLLIKVTFESNLVFAVCTSNEH